MIKILFANLFAFSALTGSAQYYLRGEIKDEKDQGLQNVKIFLHSSRLLYSSGTSGGFGITTNTLRDSVTFNLQGYEPKTVAINASVYQTVILKALSKGVTRQKQNLLSITKNSDPSNGKTWFVAAESYNSIVENAFIKTAEFANTSFALRVDKASYSNIRRFLNQGSMVPPYAVRIEEMLNYFNLNYKEPAKDSVFNFESQLTSCPWNAAHQLLYLNLSAKKIDLQKVPQGNFVFLIDVSGSMDIPNRLPLLKAAFQLLVKNLREQDTVSIVVYGGSVGVWLEPTGGNEKQKIIKAIEELTAGGDTPGEAAVKTAYALARNSFSKKGNNRIILATDGDFNVGEVNEKALEEMIIKESRSGIFLTCLGVGMGNYKDSKIETLSRNGNGNFAYIDDIREAEKVLVTEFTQTLFTVANDVFLNMQFNPQKVKEYRLIGYDNKAGVLADTSIDLEGGEIGSGNGITAVFEILPNTDSVFGDSSDEVAKAILNYRKQGDTISKKVTYLCDNNFKPLRDINKDLQFATAVTMFGLVIRESANIPFIELIDIENLGITAANKDDYLQNEFLQLVAKAKVIYPKKKKKKLPKGNLRIN
ncbi:MAG: von Willebrand factor type A domain-containing protein [Ginsengibacter sp.]